MPQHTWDDESDDEEYAREIQTLLERYVHHPFILEYEFGQYLCMLRCLHVTRCQPTTHDLLRQYCDVVIAEARTELAALDPRLLTYLDESVLYEEEE